jgi:hypothetical protein
LVFLTRRPKLEGKDGNEFIPGSILMKKNKVE